MINDNINSIIDTFKDQVGFYESEAKKYEQKALEVKTEYQEHLWAELHKCFKENHFFKTNDGYIAVNKLKIVHVAGFDRLNPRVTVEGFHLRAIDSTSNNHTPYGYYDTMAGFLISELTPVSPDVFCEKVKLVAQNIVDHLPYKPDYMYREEGDVFDNFIRDARKSKLYIEYYPEVKVTLLD